MKHYQLRIWIQPDWTVTAPDLPGCASEGEDLATCITNIREAFCGLVEEYKADIPWIAGGPRPMFTEERRIHITTTE